MDNFKQSGESVKHVSNCRGNRWSRGIVPRRPTTPHFIPTSVTLLFETQNSRHDSTCTCAHLQLSPPKITKYGQYFYHFNAGHYPNYNNRRCKGTLIYDATSDCKQTIVNKKNYGCYLYTGKSLRFLVTVYFDNSLFLINFICVISTHVIM